MFLKCQQISFCKEIADAKKAFKYLVIIIDIKKTDKYHILHAMLIVYNKPKKGRHLVLY